MSHKNFSFIIPCRNEEKYLAATLDSIIESIAFFYKPIFKDLKMDNLPVEIIIVNNKSTDNSEIIAKTYQKRFGIQIYEEHMIGVAFSRNLGALKSCGDILIFVDADTLIPKNSVNRVFDLYYKDGIKVGITKISSSDGGKRAWCWWKFWEIVRYLPLAKAKAMPAFLFCDKEYFFKYGGFNEKVKICEEWQLMKAIYKYHKNEFIYDHKINVLSSARRMRKQDFGYIKTFIKYVICILFYNPRKYYTDKYR